MNYKNLSVLVTGGAGFIGSRLVKALVEQGARVTVLDNLTTGSLDNLKDFLDKVIFIKQSVTDINACLHAIYKQNIIFHCAALTSVDYCNDNISECYNTNVTGTQNILEAARFHNIKKIIFSSSAAVYGDTQERCTEYKTTRNPCSAYGYSKLLGELLCEQYTKIYNLDTAILRYFNVYAEDNYLTSKLVNVIDYFKYNMHHNNPLTIYGDGTQTRDFVHVNTIVKANILLGLIKNNQSSIYNIASGKSITLLDLINRLRQEFPEYTQEIIFKEKKAGHIMYSQANNSSYKLLEENIKLPQHTENKKDISNLKQETYL